MSYGARSGSGYGNQRKRSNSAHTYKSSMTDKEKQDIFFKRQNERLESKFADRPASYYMAAEDVPEFTLPPKAFIRRVLIQQLVKERGYADILAGLQQIQMVPEYQDSPERTAEYQSDLAWLQRHEADITSEVALQDVSENIP